MISNKDLLFALDSTENVVVMTDLEGKITYTNKAFVNTYGYTVEEAIGKNPSILKSGYHDDIFYQNMWQTLNMGDTWTGVFRNKAKDGTLIWEYAKISPIISDGVKTGYVAVKENITYKRNLEEQIQKEQFLMNELFNNAPIGITISEPIYQKDEIIDFIYIKSNPVAGSIFNRLGLVGVKYSKVYNSMLEHLSFSDKLIKDKLTFELYLPEIDKYLSFRTFPIDQVRFCSMFFDITNYKNTIRALKESEDRYSSLVEDTPALICRFNKEGLLTYVNNQFSNSFIKNGEDLTGQSFFNLFPAKFISGMWDKIEKLSTDVLMVDFENEVEIQGDNRWQKWVIRALNSEQQENNSVEYQAVGMDFTDLKKAENALIENRNKLNAIVNNDVVGVEVVNRDGQFVYVNSRFCNMTGYTADELMKLSSLEITEHDSRDLTSIMLSKIFEGEISDYSIEKKYMRKDGSIFWASLYLSPIRDNKGRVIEASGLVADINEKKLIEIKIVENEQKLKDLNATKDKLFSIIAHDIKNPFGVILGFSNLLSERLSDLSEDEIREFINQIVEAGENTYKLLEDLLTWGRSQLGKIEIKKEKIIPKDIVEEIFTYYSHLAHNKGLSLKNGLSPQLMFLADFDIVKFVLRNLIHNAIKFTPAGGTIECYEELTFKNDYKTIIVKDTGIGISKEKIKVLFDIDEFISTTGTSDEKGTGLGLSLAKEMIIKNGGQISVESEVHKGTSFRLELPTA